MGRRKYYQTTAVARYIKAMEDVRLNPGTYTPQELAKKHRISTNAGFTMTRLGITWADDLKRLYISPPKRPITERDAHDILDDIVPSRRRNTEPPRKKSRKKGWSRSLWGYRITIERT